MNIKNLVNKPTVKLVTIVATQVAAVVIAQIVVKKIADAVLED